MNSVIGRAWVLNFGWPPAGPAGFCGEQAASRAAQAAKAKTRFKCDPPRRLARRNGGLSETSMPAIALRLVKNGSAPVTEGYKSRAIAAGDLPGVSLRCLRSTAASVRPGRMLVFLGGRLWLD